jgi:CheY-like chemotaxis protein
MCVLVVEDEPLVRAVAVEALEAEGFEVIEAPSADYAVTLLRSRDDIDVVFTGWSARVPCRRGSAGMRRRPALCASPTASRRSRRSSAG